MAAPVGLRPIPWSFVDHDLMKVWTWRTEHFEARVSADFNSFSWEILDLMTSPDGEGRFLTEGRAKDFAVAENEVREIVGKSYPLKCGYGPYAGAFATTFRIATGENIDFGAYVGSRSVVTVRLPTGVEQSFIGDLRVVHYEIHLTPAVGNPLRILPGHIVKVAGEGGANRSSVSDSYTGSGRLYRGEVIVQGCNGRLGFFPGTIDHTGDACSVHEDTRPRFG